MFATTVVSSYSLAVAAKRRSVDPNEPPSFGGNVRKLRERVGLTQEKLAERLGLRRPTPISLMEGPRRREIPKPPTVRRIAAALGVDPWELMDGVITEYDRLRRGQPEKERAEHPSERYTSSTTAQPPGTQSHAGSDPVVAFSAALSSAKLPSDVEAFVQAIHQHMQRLTDTRLLLERVGIAAHNLRRAGAHAVRSRRDAVDPPPHQERHRKPLRPASRRQA